MSAVGIASPFIVTALLYLGTPITIIAVAHLAMLRRMPIVFDAFLTLDSTRISVPRDRVYILRSSIKTLL